MAFIGGEELLARTITFLWYLKVVSMELAIILLACYKPMDRVTQESYRCKSASQVTQKVEHAIYYSALHRLLLI